jgi:acetyl esterase
MTEPSTPAGRPSGGERRRGGIDPRARAFLAWLDLIGWPRLAERSPAQARRDLRILVAATSRLEPVGKVEDRTIAGPGGPLRLRIYTPRRGRGPRPVQVWFHGGGFVVGDLFSADATCRALANRSGAVVVSVDYRLAPEHPPPAAVQDCVAATGWVAAHAGDIGADPARLAVGGDSAGGALAALVTLAAREAGPRIVFQLLVYPATDLALTHPSVAEYGGPGSFLDGDTLAWFAGHYLGRRDPADPALSPFYATDLAGLPPALVITAECDPVRDDGEAYAARLKDAGGMAEVVRYPGQLHGFFAMDLVFPAARRAQRRAGDALADAFGEPSGARPSLWPASESLLRIGGAMAGVAATLVSHHTRRLARAASALQPLGADRTADGDTRQPVTRRAP